MTQKDHFYPKDSRVFVGLLFPTPPSSWPDVVGNDFWKVDTSEPGYSCQIPCGILISQKFPDCHFLLVLPSLFHGMFGRSFQLPCQLAYLHKNWRDNGARNRLMIYREMFVVIPTAAYNCYPFTSVVYQPLCSPLLTKKQAERKHCSMQNNQSDQFPHWKVKIN